MTPGQPSLMRFLWHCLSGGHSWRQASYGTWVCWCGGVRRLR